MDSKKGVSKGVIIGIVAIVFVVIAIIAGAFYVQSNKPDIIEQETLEGGSITLTYTDDENLFVIENAAPTSDLVGTKYDSADKYFDFTVKTNVDEADYIEYQIILVKDETLSTVLDSNIKVYLEKEDRGTYTKVNDPLVFTDNVKEEKLGDPAMSIFKIKKASSGNDNYRLRMWIADTAVVSSEQLQNYAVKIMIKGEAK